MIITLIAQFYQVKFLITLKIKQIKKYQEFKLSQLI